MEKDVEAKRELKPRESVGQGPRVQKAMVWPSSLCGSS